MSGPMAATGTGTAAHTVRELGTSMNLENFQEMLEHAKDNELFRLIQRCVCMSLAEAGNPHADSHVMLDFCYAECERRHKLWLYDKAYETVCRHGEICNAVSTRA